MKYLVSFSLSFLVALTVLSVMPVHGEAEIYSDVLRLHILAESDSEKDQALKLKVRDAVLRCVSERVADCRSLEEALFSVEEMSEEISRTAEACVYENGEDCTVTLTLGRERYPRREYDGASLPAGIYSSLRITLGEGEGKNWWCVLFPTVCMGFAEKCDADEEYIAAGFTPEEYRLITGHSEEIKVRFRILEILSDIFGFRY